MFLKKAIKYAIITISLLAVAVFFQAIYFRHVMFGNSVLEGADLIVVFSGAHPGTQGRIKAGYQLAREGYAAYHMPRSYFLLYTLLAGARVKIQTYLVSIDDDQSLRMAGLFNKGKLIYNEMVKCWTSAGEMIFYKITGGLFRAKPGIQSTIKSVKSWILFNPSQPSFKE